MTTRVPESPFFRGDKGEDTALICDRLGGTTCCDEPSVYLIEWQHQPGDLETTPVSGSCERHALDVDRSQVVRISSHPAMVP